MRRAVALVLVVALLVGVLVAALDLLGHSGSTPSSSSTPTRSASARPSEPSPALDPRLARFDDQHLSWSACAGRPTFRCSRLRVPLDYGRPDGRTITLALLKVPAADPKQRIGTLVVNPGGPGAPGTSYAAAGASAFSRDLLAHYDVVGFDPRGTGSSSPIDCLSDDALDTYLAADPDPHTLAGQRALVGRVRTFNRGCVARSGALAGHVSTVETVRDMDVLRAALGESRLDFLGASYGTELGAFYAELYPRNVGRMVLDGAVDPQLTRAQATLQNARSFQVALDAYLQHCVAQGRCVLGDTVAAAQTRLEQFLTATEATPLPTSSGRSLTGGLALYGVLFALYSRDYWSILSAGLQQALAGDGSTLLVLADAINSRGPNGYTDNLQEAIVDISCLDDPATSTLAQVRAALPAFQRASPIFGQALAWGDLSCAGFTPRAAEPQPDNHAVGAPPLLVIGTTRDPATPYAWAVALSHQLSSAVLVRRDGDGHTGYHAGNACVDRTVDDYLLDGTVPPGMVSC